MAKFKRKNPTVDAVQLKAAIGDNSPGDWLVTEGENQFFMSDGEFNDNFEEVPDFNEKLKEEFNKPTQVSPTPGPSKPPRPQPSWGSPRTALLIGNGNTHLE